MAMKMLVALIYSAAAASIVPFDDGWRFKRGDCETIRSISGVSPPCAAAAYDASNWRQLNVP